MCLKYWVLSEEKTPAKHTIYLESRSLFVVWKNNYLGASCSSAFNDWNRAIEESVSLKCLFLAVLGALIGKVFCLQVNYIDETDPFIVCACTLL